MEPKFIESVDIASIFLSDRCIFLFESEIRREKLLQQREANRYQAERKKQVNMQLKVAGSSSTKR